jgi:hypothetical protein
MLNSFGVQPTGIVMVGVSNGAALGEAAGEGEAVCARARAGNSKSTPVKSAMVLFKTPSE